MRSLLATLLLFGPLVAQSGHVLLTPIRDGTIYESGVTANGAGNLVVGRTATCSIRRALLRFDVAGAVPAGATIQDVTFTLPVIGGSTTLVIPNVVPIEFRRILQDWGEGTTVPGQLGQGAPPTTGAATWLHRFYPSASWSTPGGDFAAPSGSLALSTSGDASASAFTAPGLLVDVQQWLDQPATNFGYGLLPTAANCQFTRVLCSRECAGVQPTLAITWTLGGATPASASRDGFVYPGTTPDRQLLAVGSPVLGSPAFRLQLPVIGPLPSLYAGLVANPAYLGSVDLFLHLDLSTVIAFSSAGFGPFPAAYDPATFFPTWTFPIPNDPSLENLVVSFQAVGGGPFGGTETTNAVTLRLGH